METFKFIWELLNTHGVVPSKKAEAATLWATFSIEQQREIYRRIRDKIRRGKFVDYNPANAIRDNVPRAPRTQVLSYDEYYQRFGTTQPLQGWKMVRLEDQQKTIYIKQCTS